MADSVVSFLIKKLAAFEIEEESLWPARRSDIKDIRFELEVIQSFLRDADGRTESDSLKVWVGQVREGAFNVEDILDEYVCGIDRRRKEEFRSFFLLRTICGLPKNIYYEHRLAARLHEMNFHVHEVARRRERYNLRETGEERSLSGAGFQVETAASRRAIFELEDYTVGRKEDFELIVKWLLEYDEKVRVISVVGMGGVGKTALVSKVIKHDQVRMRFNCLAFVSISQNPSRGELLRSIVKQVWQSNKEVAPDGLASMSATGLMELIFDHLRNKSYFIVLDDVWSIKDWEDIGPVFPDGGSGSRLMVTTRNLELAHAVGPGEHVCILQSLHEAAAWDLFNRKAFGYERCPSYLEELARRIVQKCEGLPLAIAAIGGLLSRKEKSIAEWTNVYNSLSFQLSSNPMFQSLHNILFLSFYQLPYYLKHCFLYCSVFPEDYLIKRKRLIRLWVAEGFVEERNRMTMEEVAEEYLNELIFRNTLQIAEINQSGGVKACRMHNMMREAARHFAGEEQFFLEAHADNAWQLGKFRRISISDGGEILESGAKTSSRRLRSILVFKNVKNTPFISSLATRFRLLRVLDLSGAEIVRVPDQLTELLNLRYLNLAGTRVDRLPYSVGKLQNLQTLDLRFTMIERLPNGIGKLQKLRHLFWCRLGDSEEYTSFHSGTSIKIPPLLCRVTSLQSLSVIEGGGEISRLIGNLTQLRSLSIAKVRTTDGFELCTSIRRMEHLVRLGINAIDEDEELDLEFLSPPLLLQKLQLKGKLKRVPQWLASLPSLTHLQLHWSRLSGEEGHELLSMLQALPNLVMLQFGNAYDGEKLLFQDGWFPKLKVLTLIDLKCLRGVVIEKGAMPSLQKLNLRRCRELKEFPQGIEHLAILEELSLCEMPMELDGDEVREKVARVPFVRKERMSKD